MNRIIIVSLFITVVMLTSACKTEPPVVQPGFYFWKSNSLQLSEVERKYIDTLQIEKLYVKFFEVAADPVFGNAPISKTSVCINKWDKIKAEVIPVVFIKNEIFFHTSKGVLDSLADNINFLVNKIIQERVITTSREIQVDCDWTATTRDNYFHLLQALKKVSGKAISVTLRLYPYKYPDKMGIPPADKAILMCYNLVNALKNESKNSILEPDELEKYMGQHKKYPVHLDIALPAYSWMLIYQNEKFIGVINQYDDNILNILTPINRLWYEVSRDTVVDNHYLRRGDRIKHETVTPDVLQQAANIVKRNIEPDDTITVSVFHLDEQKLHNYSYEILHNVYATFSR